ncbi:AraC family transcriptional regulator [Paenibacillus guangzhouensis]|uniref:AraC family transcriptional regulator n=1 Tax=Paenibacillus guangzhouensis TaxID=1473112 RepID=UPI001266CB51|nr:helix-turn-helix domain-containing protein [Paenibacillus guangzhouensis]
MSVPFKLQSNRLYTKLLFAFTVTVTILIIGLSVLLYRNYNTASLANENRLRTSMLNQISYSMNYMDNLAQKFMSSVIVGSHVPNLLYNRNGDKMVLDNALRNLDMLVVTNDYVHSVYTISLPLDRIASTEDGGFYSADRFYDQDVINLLQRWDSQASFTSPIARRIPKANSPTDFINVYTYILPFQKDSGKQPREAVVVNIKSNALRELIASINNKTDTAANEIIVIDSNGTVVNHTSEDMFLRNIRDEAYVQTVIASDQASGSFETKIDGQSYNIAYVSSTALNWKFISRISYQSFMLPVNAVKSSTLITSIIVLLLGYLFSLVMSKSIYSPFGKLIETVRLKSDELEQKQRDQRLPLRTHWLKELLLGNKNVNPKELLSLKADLGIKTNLAGVLRIIVFRLDHYRLFLDKYNEKERGLLKYAIANIIETSSTGKFASDVIEMDADKLVLLLESSDQADEHETADLLTLVQSIQRMVQEYLNFSISAAVSNPIASRALLSEAYADTLALSLYRMSAGHGSILTPAFRTSIRFEPSPFPEGKVKLLLDSLKLGHMDKVKKYFDEFVQGLAFVPYETMLSSYIHLMFMISSSYPSVADHNSNARISNAFHTFFSKIDYFETVEEIHQTFESLFAEIVITVDAVKHNKRKIVVDRIKKLIDEQYQDKNLNLSILAEEFQMSNVYLGRVFKESTGESVAEYITKVRMARVKHLLNESNLSTKEILEQCGWEDLNYFYTLFKKHFGVSLTQYKLLMKSGDQQETS